MHYLLQDTLVWKKGNCFNILFFSELSWHIHRNWHSFMTKLLYMLIDFYDFRWLGISISRFGYMHSHRGKWEWERGVVWYTQGSGKSNSMFCFAAKITHQAEMKTPYAAYSITPPINYLHIRWYTSVPLPERNFSLFRGCFVGNPCSLGVCRTHLLQTAISVWWWISIRNKSWRYKAFMANHFIDTNRN